MFKAFVLVRNFGSSAARLNFGDFSVSKVEARFEEFQKLFSSEDVHQHDWIFEKEYQRLPPGPPGSFDGGIPDDVEDILLLLRLYKPGDIAFIRLAILQPSGKISARRPYRAMNDLNSYASVPFEIDTEECQAWKAFADGIRGSRSWDSDWFAAARRFFLSGGAKPFNPKGDDVDRMVDYATSLEAALVPEKDYNMRRMRNRAAALIAPENGIEADDVVKTIKRIYEIRSRIVHGSRLGEENREWLLQNSGQVELRVREILVKAVKKLPPGDEDRRAGLAKLYDPTDDDHGSIAFEKFKEIKSAEVRKATATKIAKLVPE